MTSLSFANFEIERRFIIYQTELTYVFTNLRPALEGHILISPIRRVQYFHDLTSAERLDLLRIAEVANRVMKCVVNAEASQVTLQDGPAAGQTVPHLHLHVIPRHLPTVFLPPQTQPPEVREKLTAEYRRAFLEALGEK